MFTPTMQKASVTKTSNRRYVMKSGYESLEWVNDKRGKEFVCNIPQGNKKRSFEDLSDDEKKRCYDVNQIVGTERW